MCQWRPFVRLIKTAPKSDIFILVLTFVLTVVFDLVVAIGVGIVLACVLFMKRMSDQSGVHGWKYVGETGADGKSVAHGVRIYEVTGPLFFGSAETISEITLKDYTRCLVLRMRSVTAIDATALNALEELYDKCAARGVKIVFSHVNEQPMHSLIKSGLSDKVGREYFAPNIDNAIDLATEIAEEAEMRDR